MSPLTKTFVILLVVMSLLSAAGFIVFVNQVQNFRSQLTAVNATLGQAQSDRTTATSKVLALQAQLADARKDADAAQAEVARVSNENATKIADLQATIATDKSQAAIAAVTADNLTNALNASEAQRKGLTEGLASARTDSDRLNKQLSDADIAISDLTNKNDVANRKVADFEAQLTEAKANNEKYSALLKERGLVPDAPAPDRLTLSVPPINAVVRDTRPINGIPYATISVGSAENVQKGMVFHVVDRDHGRFLGDLTIDSVDLHEATGKLEGPAIADVRVGTDARTQL